MSSPTWRAFAATPTATRATPRCSTPVTHAELGDQVDRLAAALARVHDTALTEQARAALARATHRPAVVVAVGDGDPLKNHKI